MKRLLLVLSLLGMISQAVEPLKIKDINGVEFTVGLIQKNALKRCKTFEPFLVESERVEGMEEGPIDFGATPRSFITQANIQQLAAIINNPEEIKKINDNKTALELFQLADYAMAPKKIVRALAADAKIVIAERVAPLDKVATLNEEQAAERYNLLVAHQGLENNKFDVHELLRKLSKNPNIKNNLCKDGLSYSLDLSYESTKRIAQNKLQSLNGIERLANAYGPTHYIYLDNQDIEKIDLGLLQKKFSQLSYVSLKNNLIKSVSETQAIRKLTVALTCNPLKSITIKNPERCNYLNFKTDNPEVKVDFVQNRYSKIHTWLKAFVAKAKVMRSCYLPNFTTFSSIVGGVMGVAGALFPVFEYQDRSENQAELGKLVLAKGKEILLANNVLEEVKGIKLSSIVEKYGQDARIVPLKELISARKDIPYTSSFLDGVCSGALVATAVVAIGSAVVAAVDTGVRLYGGGGMFECELNEKMKKTSHRIDVRDSDDICTIAYFPSNYTYNLLGKN